MMNVVIYGKHPDVGKTLPAIRPSRWLSSMGWAGNKELVVKNLWPDKATEMLWRSLHSLLGAGGKNELPVNSASGQQFVDYFDAKVAAVWQATGSGYLWLSFHRQPWPLITSNQVQLMMSDQSLWVYLPSRAVLIRFQQLCWRCFLVGRVQLYRLSVVDTHTVAQIQYTGK